MDMKHILAGPTFTQDEVVALRTLVDASGSAMIEKLLNGYDVTPAERTALNFSISLFGSISKKLEDSVAYLPEYR